MTVTVLLATPDETTAMASLAYLVDEFQDPTTPKLVNRQLSALTQMTDLFMSGSGRHSTEQVELFDEIFKTLVTAIELKTRMKLANALAAAPDTPGILARAFAFDSDIDVAGPVLSQSTALTEADLALNASTQGQDHLEAIARRQTISETVTDILIERGEAKVVHTVAKNAGARISDGGFRQLVVRAGDDASLALHIGRRPDLPRHHFLKLVEIAAASVRAKIVAAHLQFADEVRDAVTEVVDDINLQVRSQSKDHAKAKSRVKRLQNWKDLGEADLHAAARSQNFERTALVLAALAGCRIEMAERATLNEDPGALEVLAKVAGISWPTLKTLLLMRAAARNMSKRDLDQCREHFEQLETQTAKRVLEFHEARRTARGVGEPDTVSATAVNSETLGGANQAEVIDAVH
jgi:uncharacterized protein (DUF2336 family)